MECFNFNKDFLLRSFCNSYLEEEGVVRHVGFAHVPAHLALDAGDGLGVAVGDGEDAQVADQDAQEGGEEDGGQEQNVRLGREQVGRVLGRAGGGGG